MRSYNCEEKRKFETKTHFGTYVFYNPGELNGGEKRRSFLDWLELINQINNTYKIRLFSLHHNKYKF